MISLPEANSFNKEFFEYRGYRVTLQYDERARSFYTIDFPGSSEDAPLFFGVSNYNYKEDLKNLIDRKLDLICEFPLYPGAKLKYFQNGSSRDIRLVYNFRILKIFLAEMHGKVLKKLDLIQESISLLNLVGQKVEQNDTQSSETPYIESLSSG